MLNELERYRKTIFALLEMRNATHELIMSFVQDYADIYMHNLSDEERAIAMERVRNEADPLPGDLRDEIDMLFFGNL